MICPDKRSLARKYGLYVRAYSEAVEQLSLIGSKAARADWDLAWALASRARQMCDDAFSQLQKHKEEHGC
jgi:hypothetical protein